MESSKPTPVSFGLKAQHRNTFLGYFWWLLDPLLGVGSYYFVVVLVFRRGGDNYGIYLLIGLIVWRWLSVTLSAASKSILSQASIISQVYLPKVIFPIGVTATQLVNFGFGLVVIGIFALSLSVLPGLFLVWLPHLMLILFSIGFISTSVLIGMIYFYSQREHLLVKTL